MGWFTIICVALQILAAKVRTGGNSDKAARNL